MMSNSPDVFVIFQMTSEYLLLIKPPLLSAILVSLKSIHRRILPPNSPELIVILMEKAFSVPGETSEYISTNGFDVCVRVNAGLIMADDPFKGNWNNQ